MMESQYRVCSHCKIKKPIIKFGKVNKTRRRKCCTKCHYLRMEANRLGVQVQDFIDLNTGPCLFCGLPDGKIYFSYKTGLPAGRLCPKHLKGMEGAKEFNRLLLMNEVMENFPFWVDFLKTGNFQLFALGT